jgi:hypothetical protein
MYRNSGWPLSCPYEQGGSDYETNFRNVCYGAGNDSSAFIRTVVHRHDDRQDDGKRWPSYGDQLVNYDNADQSGRAVDTNEFHRNADEEASRQAREDVFVEQFQFVNARSAVSDALRLDVKVFNSGLHVPQHFIDGVVRSLAAPPPSSCGDGAGERHAV